MSKTAMEAMDDLNRSFKELQRAIAGNLTPTLQRLNASLAVWHRELYLARIRRWVAYALIALAIGAIVGWIAT